jgi:hypothetical protein
MLPWHVWGPRLLNKPNAQRACVIITPNLDTVACSFLIFAGHHRQKSLRNALDGLACRCLCIRQLRVDSSCAAWTVNFTLLSVELHTKNIAQCIFNNLHRFVQSLRGAHQQSVIYQTWYVRPNTLMFSVFRSLLQGSSHTASKAWRA